MNQDADASVTLMNSTNEKNVSCDEYQKVILEFKEHFQECSTLSLRCDLIKQNYIWTLLYGLTECVTCCKSAHTGNHPTVTTCLPVTMTNVQ